MVRLRAKLMYCQRRRLYPGAGSECLQPKQHYKAHVRIDKLEVRKLSPFPLRFVHTPQSGHVVKARFFHIDNGGPGYLW